jgi:hypothetical protein
MYQLELPAKEGAAFQSVAVNRPVSAGGWHGACLYSFLTKAARI